MKYRSKLSLLILAFLLSCPGYLLAQKFGIDHIEPTFWWTGMKHKSLQIMIHGKDISDANVSVSYPGVKFERKVTVSNPDYVFLYVDITKEAKPGEMPVVFSKNGKKYTYEYQLKSKSTSEDRYQGFNSSDIIYLLMPDRFANGDPSNDNVKGMIEKKNLKDPSGRHGGDIKGIEDHLRYIKDLGVTAIWINPLVENNMPTNYHAYHGYAATNLYKIDPRYGSNQDYVDLVSKAHNDGLKIIMDMVMNHIGSNHWWMKDPPTKDWVHSYSKYGQTNYRIPAVSDPHASKYDEKKMEKGWFVKAMPDLNQNNPLEATYLIQNTIWWIEYSGIDGIRMDTYPYPNKHFMKEWVQAVKEEFPTLNIVGEVSVHDVGIASYWQEHKHSRDGYNSHLTSITDYPLKYAIVEAFTQPYGWHSGIMQIYYTLAQDFLYSKPDENVIFFDNHDTNRFGGLINKDKDLFKMGMAFLLTTRGIPQIYYGDEIMRSSLKNGNDGNVRRDFPGGWPGDKHNAFTQAGRSPLQNEIFDYTRKLMHFRDNNPVLATGRLMQFIPENDVYVYFRYNKNKTIMVVMNLNKKEYHLNNIRFAERMDGFNKALNVVTGKTLTHLKSFDIPAKTAWVMELEK